MKGYFTAQGYYGNVDGRYVLFASESEYYEAMEDGKLTAYRMYRIASLNEQTAVKPQAALLQTSR